MTEGQRKDLPLVSSPPHTAPRAIDLDALFEEYEALECSLDQDGCLTCGDVAVPVTVQRAGELDAVCIDAYGHEGRVAIELVAPVAQGDRLLVHAGVAIEKLESPAGQNNPDVERGGVGGTPPDVERGESGDTPDPRRRA